MPHRRHRFLCFILALLPGVAAAMPFPDEFVGPPSYSLMGCPYDKEWSRDVVQQATGFSDAVLDKMERKWGYTPQRVCGGDPLLVKDMAASAAKVKPLVSRFDQPDKATQQRLLQSVDENGQIPPDALSSALAVRQTLVSPTGKQAFLEKAAGLTSGAWTSLGPGNIGGRVRSISANPNTPGDILIGSVSGGLWRTLNSGSSWSVVNDFMPNVAISCLTRDPQNANTIYACTGEGMFNSDAVRGLGIFKSIDGGNNWTQISSTNPPTSGSDWYYVNRIAVSPTNSSLILAGTNGGLYRSIDGGSTWTKVYDPVGTGRWRSVMDVVFHPTNGNIALLGESQYFNCLSTCVLDGFGVAYSADGGATWTRTKLNTSAISGSQGRVEVAISKSNPSIAYAVVDYASGQLYKSTNGGLSWTPNAPISTPAHMGAQGWYNNSIWIAPNDENRVIVGGVSLKMSTNGGSTFAAIGSNVHVDHHAFESDPNYASNFTLYNGNDGGVYKATGGNTSSPTFTSLNNGLAITQFYGGAGKSGGRILGGAQDVGTLLWTGTMNWVHIWGGDGGDSAADPLDGSYVYGMTQYGSVVRYTQALSSTPPADSSQYICYGVTDISCGTAPGGKILFIPPLVMDPNNNQTLYLGAEQLWRSTNIKTATNTSVSFSSIKPTLTAGVYISAIAVAPTNSNVMWIGYQNGKVSCTTNALASSPTWTETTGGPARYVTRITIDPTNPNIVYVGNGGYSSPNIRVTTGGCTSAPVWTSIHNTLPAAPIRGIAVHPNNPSWIYVGTEVGLFDSQDGGAHWTTTNDGPGTVSVEELFFLDATTLIAVTHGRGMFQATVLSGGVPSFTSSPPPGGYVNVAYNFTVTANGSPAPTFSVTSGALPTGVTLNGTTGVISGTPTVIGSFTGVITAANSNGSATQSFTIPITSGTPGAPVMGTATAGNGSATFTFSPPTSIGASLITSYTVTCNPGAISATGPSSPITVTGLTNGTVYTCSVAATNTQGTGPSSGTVSVTPTGNVPLFTSGAPPAGTYGVAYSHTFVASGSPAPTYTVTSGALPTGLSLNTTTGAVSGTPSATGTFTGVVTAANSSGSATQGFSIAISATVPGAPVIGAATPGTLQASIAFTAPASNGGTPITGYTASCTPGPLTASGAASPITVTGMTAGATYSCSVKATNAIGTGAASGSVSVAPLFAPTITSAAPPAGTFGTAYSFTYTATGNPAPTFSVTSGALPGGLSLNAASGVLSGTPNAAGPFTGVVTATNSAGTTTQSFSIAIAATVPGAPTIGTATPGNAQASIAFTAPASNGGSAITSYKATCNPGGLSGTAAASPVTVTGLTNGTAYTCSVTATNAAGTGAASGTVGVTPGTAPAITSLAPPAGTFNVAYSFTYTATGVPAPTFSVTSGTLPTGLTLNPTSGVLSGTPSAAGTFTGVVTATNSLGTATQNFSIAIAATAPGAPTIGTGTAGNTQATISFTPPSNTGGSAITSYTATCTPGPFSASGATSPITVTGLANGTTYSCSVTATNAIGTSTASGSVSVTPAAAPTFSSAAPPNGSYQVAYSYTVTANGSPAPTFSVTSGALPTGLTLSSAGLLSGTPTVVGTFTGVITASNAAGTATQNFSIAINATVPGAPTIGTATPGNAQATISFTAPASNGGAAITSYTATCGAFSASGATSPITVTGLTNGTTYSCSVKATNSAGSSAASGSVSVTPGVAPAITSLAPPAGSFAVAYSYTVTASGSPAPTFSVTTGTLPTGLTLASSGAITGTPSATGTFNGVITATNTAGTATQGFSIVINATVPGAPTIGTGTAGNGQATISFTAPANNGGSAITSYTATCGAFSATGAASPITVTGLTNGTAYTCSVKATNAVGSSAASGTVSVTPGVAPAITSAAPPAGTYGVAYAFTYTASGSPAPTFSVTSGTLPPGLTLNASGALSGTPTTAGTYTGVVTATNAVGLATQNFSIAIAAVVPGAPTIGTATPGAGQATISFTPPASNGGSAITGYTATCGASSASGSASPIVVSGLTNNVTYSCSVRATNVAGTGPASGTVSVTPTSGIALALSSVASRKTHALGGDFDLPIDNTQPIGGAVTVEPRLLASGHKIVFTFNDTVGSVASAACVDASAAAVGSTSVSISGSSVIVTITGVPDDKRVTVSITGVNGTYNASASVGFLAGDVNSSRSVTSADILMIQGRGGQVTNSGNFRYDIDLNGSVNSQDTGWAHINAGLTLP